MIRRIIITSAIIAVSYNVYGQGLTVETIKANLDNQSYLVNNGKERISLEHIVNRDGTIETKVKRSYLPAVTDGKIIDKTKSFKLALNAKKFGKYLTKGAGYATFAQMAIDILGSGVDYVLDQKNNSVQITTNTNVVWKLDNQEYNNADDACKAAFNRSSAFASNKKYVGVKNVGDRFKNGAWIADCYYEYTDIKIQSYFNVNGLVKSKSDVKVMSEEEFAKEILKAAQNNDKAKKVIVDYAKNEIKNGDHDSDIKKVVDELNNDTDTSTDSHSDDKTTNTDTSTNQTTGTTTDNKTDTTTNTQTNQKENKDKKEESGNFELPPFCKWASHVCKFIDWFKEDPNNLGESDKIDILVHDRNDLAYQDINKQYYNAVGQCPAPAVVNTNFGQIKIPYDTLCSFFSRHSPILIAIAYLIGGYIVIGRK